MNSPGKFFLSVDLVLSFLKDIESKRNNSPSTRNHRLAVLRTFFSYLATQEPQQLHLCQKICLIPFKRAPKRLMEYLEVEEMNAIIKAANKGKSRRDFVLLSLMYNTGARVQEICGLKVSDLYINNPSFVKITGKGNKTRQVPIWESTQKILEQYLKKEALTNENDFVFKNRNRQKLSRYGVRYLLKKYSEIAQNDFPSLKRKNIGPHTLRHTTAMHLLQSGVDLNVIKTWLGHVDISTTHGYVEIDMKMKQEALNKCRPESTIEMKQFSKANRDVISWLESL